MSNHGFLVISLDFELYWGMFDKVSLTEYGQNIRGAHEAIPEMLALFSSYGIHVTWATVGMLMCENKTELLQYLPTKAMQPNYTNTNVSAYEHIKHAPIGENEHDDPYHFGKSLAKRILQTPHQELGSHTFSHYYCIDGSENNRAIFAADCEAFNKVSISLAQTISSIVFPRNQVTAEALSICEQFGFRAYRGTPKHFLYSGKTEAQQTTTILRILRLMDTYINLSGHHTHPISTIYRTNPKESELINVQGSWFLRPYSKTLAIFEPLKIRRIKKAMTHAAKHGETYHLWWHPHNFGINRKENLNNLLSILEHFKTLQTQYGMQSANMQEMAQNQNNISQ